MRTLVPQQNQPQKRESGGAAQSKKAAPTPGRDSPPASDSQTGHDFGRIPVHQPAPLSPRLQTAAGPQAGEDGGVAEGVAGARREAGLISPPVPPGLPFDPAPRFNLTALSLQRKPAVGPADDAFEREADEVAERVMRAAGAGPVSSAPGAIQRKCGECAEEESEDEQVSIQRKPAPSASGGATPTTGTLTSGVGAAVRAASRGGVPLPRDVRSFFEPRFGHDFGNVRVHHGEEARDGARSVGARAYTIGQHIVFGPGEYAPTTTEGKRLLAHELAHTIQQSAALRIQRQPGPAAAPAADDRITRVVNVPPGVNTRQQFLRYVETVIFNKVVNLNWQADSKNIDAVLNDPSKHVGKPVTFRFKPADVAALGSEAPTASEKAAADKEYGALSKDELVGINSEIDRRYFDSTGEKPGTLIQSGERGKIAIWNSFKAQVLADKRKLDALPDAIKTMLGGAANITPDKYAVLARIADKLTPLSAAELEDYKSKTTGVTTDLSVLEKSIDRYLAEKAERERARETRENMVTKLFGGEDLYDAYKRIGAEFIRLNKLARDRQVQGDGAGANDLRAKAQASYEKDISDFNALAQTYDFADIHEFRKYLDDYEQAFLQESVAIALDVLQKYEHKLFEAEQQYTNDAAIDALLAQVQATGAPGLVAQAATKIEEAKKLSSEGRFQTVQGNAGKGNEQSNLAGQRMHEAQALTTQASNLVRNLPGQPLIQDDKFPRAALLGNDRGTAKSAIFAYISERRSDIEQSRSNLKADPKVVYKLPRIMALSYEQQGVRQGTILDKLISDRRSQYQRDEAYFKVLLGVIGIALTVVTAGGGTLAAAGALGAAGISGYHAIEEFKEYEKNSAFAGAGLLADDPSMAWVIVAVVGAFADMGAAVAAVRAVKTAGVVKRLEATSDIATFETELASIKELNAAARTNLRRAGLARLESRAWLREILIPTVAYGVPPVPLLREAGLLGVAAYYAIKRGVLTFAAWVDELRAAKVISDAKLAPAELKALKEAWEEGQQQIQRLRQNIPELEQSMKGFRMRTGIGRAVNAEGKVVGGTTAAAKTEVPGLSRSLFVEGSTKTKGASAAKVPTNTRYKSPQSFGATKNHAEQNILGDIADEIDKAKQFAADLKGKPKTGVTGEIHLHVEQSVCASCRQGLNSDASLGVVGQFSSEYPNVTLVITNMETAEVLFVRGGKIVKF
jgi:hypothetical protein